MTPLLSREAIALEVRDSIREVVDFPVPGVSFKDITPVLADARLFRSLTDVLASRFADAGVTHVAAIESRGFLLGGPIAQSLGAALVPVRKLGKLPYRTERVDYALEYGSATIEVHVDAWSAGDRILIVDDVLATGGTADAACQLVERMGARVMGLAFLLSLTFLPGEELLRARRVETLVRY
ncbi:MAG: adenine phosphoribosyltransferase [Gemmatimonadaceae bacterium]